MTTLGKEIKVARARKGLKQKEVAVMVGTSQKRLSLIETDKVDASFSMALRIARALGISLDVLVAQEEDHAE